MTARRSLVPALLATLLAACGGDETKPPATCGDKGTFIRVDAPADGDLLTTDVNVTRPQFQGTIAASTDLPDGSNVQVIVNGDVAADTVRVASGKIETQVTLLTGANTVVLSTTVCGKPVKGAVAVSVAPDGCEFVAPLVGIPIDGSLDGDPGTAGVQTDVVARCKVFTQGDTASLRIGGTGVAETTFDAQGKVTFAGISFYPGQVDVGVWNAGEKKLAAKFDVEIEGECPVTLEPVPDTMFNLGGDVSEQWPSTRGDADLDSGGIQADFTVTTDCASPTKAHIMDLSGVELAAADFESGKAVVRVLAPEGDFGVRPVVEANGKVQPGNPAGYHSDSIPPVCVIDAPTNGGAAEDGDPVKGDVQFTIRGHCTDLEPGSIVELRIAQAASGPLNTTAKTSQLAEDRTFSFDWSVVAGDYKAWVGGARPSGNRSSSTVNVNRFVAGVPSCAVTEPAANLATSNPALNVKVKSNVDPGTDIVITVTAPDDSKQTQTLKAEPSPAGGTQVTTAVTLNGEEGTHEISAQCGTAGTAAPVPVQFDLSKPLLSVQLPGSGVINQAVPDANPGTPEYDVLVTVTADQIQDNSTGTVTFACIPSGTTSAAPAALSFAANKATVSMSLAAVPEGDNCTFTANANDLAGNPASPASASAIYDRVGPTFVSSFPDQAFHLVAYGNPRVNGTTVIETQRVGSPFMSFEFQTAGASGGLLEIRDPATSTIYGSYSIAPDGLAALAVETLPQGRTVNLDVRLRDAAGNVATKQLPAVIDVIAPGTPTDATLSMTDYQSAAGELAFTEPPGDSGGSDTATAFEIRWTGFDTLTPANVFEARFQPHTAAILGAPAPTGAGNAHKVAVSFPPMGFKQVCVRAVDTVGNVGPGTCASASSDWTDQTFVSPQANGLLGFQVLAVPSVDGDSLPDLVVAERARNNASSVPAGAVHLFSGANTVAAAMASPRISVFGTDANERCGEVMVSGDFDGDGRPDLAVGCPRWSSLRGRVMVYFGGQGDVNGDGKADGFSETARAIVNGPASTTAQFGAALGRAGDLDGDGRDELIVSDHAVGATGTGDAYVLFGRSKANWATATVTDSSAVKITGEDNGDAFGYRYGAGSLGDIDGDGTPEVLIPASASNKAYVFSGSDIEAALGGSLSASKATLIQEDKAKAPGISAPSILDGFGQRSLGSDVTGDSFPDLIVTDGANGTVRVYTGNDGTNSFDSPAGQLLTVPNGEGNHFGYSLAEGDVTGDGSLDLLVGNNAQGNGAFYVFRATGDGGAAPFESIPSFKAKAGTFGVALTVLDLDGDGADEVVVGAPTEGNGTVHVYTLP